MENNKIRVFSCFAGYGTDIFALKKLGIPFDHIGFSEIDKYAIQCFKQNHGGTNWGDIMEIDWKNVPDFDLLTGGFSCQPYSVAGKGLGLSDLRGQVIYGVFNALKEKKPEYIFLENVKGLLSKKHKPVFDMIIKELYRLGYFVKWNVLNTKDYGIPQNRQRVWIIGFRDWNKFCKFEWPEEEELKIFIKDILEEEPVDQKYYLKDKQVQKLVEAIQKKMAKGVSKTIRSGGKGSLTPKHEWDLVGVQWDTSGKGYNSQQDRAYNVDGVMPCIPNANPSNKVNIFELRGRSDEVRVYEDVNPTISAAYGMGGGNVPIVDQAEIFALRGRNQENDEIEQTPEFKSDGCSNSLTSVQKDNLLMLQVPRGENLGYIKEQESCPTLSGSAWQHNNFIEDDKIIVNTQPRSPDRPSLKNGTSQGGSGVIWKEDGTTYCLDTGNAQADGLSKKEIMNTLTTELAPSTGRDFYRTSGEKILRSCGVFRRLTPKECFRLQGFLLDEIDLSNLSDTQAYKLAGNGQSLNVVTKLFEKMLNG